MHRSRLQKLVRESLTNDPTVGVEGFLGDVMTGVKKLFKKDNSPIIKEKEHGTRSFMMKEFIERLNSTVLNSTWMDKAELKDSPITDSWATEGLTYHTKYDPKQPIKHISEAIRDCTDNFKKYTSWLKKHKADAAHIYPELIKDLKAAGEDDSLIRKALDAAASKYAKVDKPRDYVKSLEIVFLGNKKVNWEQKFPAPVQGKNTPIKVHTLSKQDMIDLAKNLVDFIKEDLIDVASNELCFIDWWEEHGLSEAASEALNEASGTHPFLAEYPTEHTFDDKAIYLLSLQYESILIPSLRWLNDSVKVKE